MPHVALNNTPSGPIIQVSIGVSVMHYDAMVAAGMSPITPIKVNLLVDTGASSTNIDTNIIKKLGIMPTGTVSVHTPSTGATPKEMDLYAVSMFISGYGPMKVIQAMPVIATDFSSQGIDGLLGRDVLSHAHMTYDGMMDIVTISFI